VIWKVGNLSACMHAGDIEFSIVFVIENSVKLPPKKRGKS
jgi:hypothetical protein